MLVLGPSPCRGNDVINRNPDLSANRYRYEFYFHKIVKSGEESIDIQIAGQGKIENIMAIKFGLYIWKTLFKARFTIFKF